MKEFLLSRQAPDLSRLKIFDENLIFSTSTDIGPEELSGFYQQLFAWSQCVDLFDAYVFMEDWLVQRNKMTLDQLTPEDIVELIIEVHYLSSRTLTNGRKGFAGLDTIIFVNKIPQSILDSLTALIHQNKLTPLAVQALVGRYSELNLDPKKIYDFANALHQAKRPSHHNLNQTIRYIADNMEEVYKTHIQPILSLGTRPDLVSQKYEEFAARLLTMLKAVDNKSPQSMCELVLEIIKSVNEIHGFENGNGRTSRCLANLMLKFYGMNEINITVDYEAYDRACTALFVQRDDAPLRAIIMKHLQAPELIVHQPTIQENRGLFNLCNTLTTINFMNTEPNNWMKWENTVISPTAHQEEIMKAHARAAALILICKQNTMVDDNITNRLYSSVIQQNRATTILSSMLTRNNLASKLGCVIKGTEWKVPSNPNTFIWAYMSKEKSELFAKALNEQRIEASSGKVKDKDLYIVKITGLEKIAQDYFISVIKTAQELVMQK